LQDVARFRLQCLKATGQSQSEVEPACIDASDVPTPIYTRISAIRRRKSGHAIKCHIAAHADFSEYFLPSKVLRRKLLGLFWGNWHNDCDLERRFRRDPNCPKLDVGNWDSAKLNIVTTAILGPNCLFGVLEFGIVDGAANNETPEDARTLRLLDLKAAILCDSVSQEQSYAKVSGWSCAE